jgi:hypothetical protein
MPAMKYGVVPTNPFELLALWTGRVPVPAIDVLYGLLKARAIMAGVRLGLFEAMRDGVHEAPELAGRLRLDPSCLDLLMRTLVLCGYLEQRGAGFRLSGLARRTMIRGGRMELFEFALWNYTQWEWVNRLESLVQTGRGIDFHGSLDDPEAWGHYQGAMLEMARLDAPVVAARVPVRADARRLLDIGGSHGLLGAAICRRHPPMRSTVLDLPRAVDHARALAEAEGIADVVEHRAGNLLVDDLGADVDVVLLANILHHFTPSDVAAILRRTKTALVTGGTVAIWDLESPVPGAKVSDGDGVALFFRLTSTASTYHGTQYGEWLRLAGFQDLRIIRPALSPGTVLVVGRVR